MAQYVRIFTQPEYKLLKLAFKEGLRCPTETKRNPTLVKMEKWKETTLSLCEKTELLMADAELWDFLGHALTPFRVLRYRHFIVGNIVKGIFILHKEKAKRFYDFCEKIFDKVFQCTFNKKLDEVIVVKRIYPGIPLFKEYFNPSSVRFDREYDEELWNRFNQDSRMFRRVEEERVTDSVVLQADRQEAASIDVPDPVDFQADRQVGEVASIDVPMQEPPPVDLQVPMDIDHLVDLDFDQIISAGTLPQQQDLDQIAGEQPRGNGSRMAIEDDSPPLTLAERQPIVVQVEVHATAEGPIHFPETIQDDRHAAEPTSLDHLIADLLPDVDSIRPEADVVHVEIEPMHPGADTVHLDVDAVRPEADVVTADVEEPLTRTSPTNLIDNLPEVPPQSTAVIVEVHSVGRPVDLDAIQVDWRIEEEVPRDDVRTDLPAMEDLSIGPTPMELTGLGLDTERIVSAEICSDQPVEERVPRDDVRTDLPAMEDLSIGPPPMELTGLGLDPERIVSAEICSDQPVEERVPRNDVRTDLPAMEDLSIGPAPMELLSDLGLDSERIVSNLPELPPQSMAVTVEAHSVERPVDSLEAIQVDRRIAEEEPRDAVRTDLPAMEDLSIGPTPMELTGLGPDTGRIVSAGIRSDQPDLPQFTEETEPQPVQELLPLTETVTGKEAEMNIQQLQRDFDRIELVSVDEIVVDRVDDRPAPRPDQLEVPGIVVTELERTRIDSVTEPEVVPEIGRAELMEDIPQPGEELEMIRISELMGGDTSWERAIQKRPKKRIPVCFTPKQMKRMINRPLVKCADRPTLTAEVFAESRPNVLNPVRLILQESYDIHDAWEAPTNYADELKRSQQKDCKFTLRQLIPFSHGVIFERLKPGFLGEMTEKEQKDREMGKRAVRTILNFSKIPSQVILRFYGDESPPKIRPSFRHAAEGQQLDIPGVARKSSVPQSRESHKSLVPDASIPPRPSIEPYLVGEVLDRTVQDGSMIVQLPQPDPALILVPEEELYRTGETGEPRPSAPLPTVAIGEDLNRIETVEEARLSAAAPSHPETTVEIPPLPARITAAEDILNRIEVVEETITIPALTAAAGDVPFPEAVPLPRHSEAAHITGLEDVNRVEEAEESKLTTEIPQERLKHIDVSEVLDKLESLLDEKEGKVTFHDLCPPPSDDERHEECPPESRITRNQAAETLLLLIGMDMEKIVRLEYEVAANICESQIVIYSQ